MGFLIIAMIVSHVLTKAWEESKTQSAARWQEAQRAAAQRRAAWEDRRKTAAAARQRRVNAARKAGPSDPLWWLWAAGWLVAATARGGVAAVARAPESAPIGAPEGHP